MMESGQKVVEKDRENCDNKKKNLLREAWNGIYGFQR